MAFSGVIKGRHFRGLGLSRIGRHAAPKSEVPAPRRSPEGGKYQGLHKASGPRLSGPYEKRAA